MRNLKLRGTHTADAWMSSDDTGLAAATQTRVPYEKTHPAVLREIGVIFAATLSLVLGVNAALAVLHIG